MQQSPVILDLCFGHGNHVIIVTSSFNKSPVFKMFFVHTKTESALCLKSVFENLRFGDGLV